MASLYKRATPLQEMVLRIIEGAIKNAQDAHPEIQVTPKHRRSIAKRAAGTLTAQFELSKLAAVLPPSDKAAGSFIIPVSARRPPLSSQMKPPLSGSPTSLG